MRDRDERDLRDIRDSYSFSFLLVLLVLFVPSSRIAVPRHDRIELLPAVLYKFIRDAQCNLI